MTRAKQMACYACALLVAFAAAAGARALSNHSLAEGDLTDDEMAGLYGRTGPACIGCYSFQVVANCTGTDPCPACVLTSPPPGTVVSCPQASIWYSNNNTAYRDTVDTTNDDIWLVDSQSCRRGYTCVGGTIQRLTACDPATGCGGNHLADCRPCSRGPLQETITKPWESCDDCP
jgi:hypothetical protein